ncbi:MAG: hypothetical protein KatS3mg016_1577 [Fimbriimonadales bacterium]|nr:MAG: hypothetical protein KatS3mg016_1577 [Fimbriimonadales bacterium]
MRSSVLIWIGMLTLVALFTASLVAAYQISGGGAITGANKPTIPPAYRVLDSPDLVIEGCIAPSPTGEQEVRLKLYNTALSALRDIKMEVLLDGKPPKSPASPIQIRRFPRTQQPEMRLLFDKTAKPDLTVRIRYQWGLMGSGAGAAEGSKRLAPCRP